MGGSSFESLSRGVAGAPARILINNNGIEALRNDESVQVHLGRRESNIFANFLPAKKVAPKMFGEAAAYSRDFVVSACTAMWTFVGNWCWPESLNNSNQNLHDTCFVGKLADDDQ
jgi:hypothetical protein